VCPAHPEIEETAPGECPIDGLELVKKEPTPTVQARESTTIHIDPLITQNMNLRTATVERRDLRHPIRTVGYLEYDQERMVTVTTKYSGWGEKVHVNYVGEPVRKGQPLFEIYSPELVQTQQELLSALGFARRMANTPVDTRRRAEGLVEATRTRLGYWDISPEQIATLERSGQVLRTLTVRAPASGVVMKRMPSLEGMAVMPGMQTYHIANLSTLWLVVEIFEDQIPWIQEGTPAEINFTYFPGKTFSGAVRYIEPALSERTRTLRVKIAIPNNNRKLRAGMYATVIFGPRTAAPTLAVPSEAVLRTGERNVAVVASEGGGFTPRELVLGQEGDGWVEVLAGLTEGEQVVTSAQFLLDSEASVRAAIRRMIAARGNTQNGGATDLDPHAGHRM
jgi:Cu(I)/Ag(I) efflux system membrane fusion protein/cobalt-zinc-cadmium efflux system membrane fusion protein